MHLKRINVNENYSFKSTTSILSSYQSSLYNRSQLDIGRTWETQSAASCSTNDYVQNNMLIKVDTISRTTFLIAANPEVSASPSAKKISNVNCDKYRYCSLNKIKDCLSEFKNSLDRIDLSVLTKNSINSNNSSTFMEDITSPLINPSFEDILNKKVSVTSVRPAAKNNSFIIKEKPASLSPTSSVSDLAVEALLPIKSKNSITIKEELTSLPSTPTLETSVDRAYPVDQAHGPIDCKNSETIEEKTTSLSFKPSKIQHSKKQRSQNYRKSCVDLYNYYNYEWKRFKYPGEDNHMKERWNVYKKFFKLK